MIPFVEFLADHLLQHLDNRAISETHVIKSEKTTSAQISSDVEAGRFPRPLGQWRGERYWRYGDIVRYREGWE